MLRREPKITERSCEFKLIADHLLDPRRIERFAILAYAPERMLKGADLTTFEE